MLLPRYRRGRGDNRYWTVGVVLVCAAVHDRHDRLAQPESVDGFDQPALGVGPASEEDVGAAVEEHEHRDVGKAPGALLQAQVETGRHASHSPDLEVDDGDVGGVLGDRWEHLRTGGYLTHGVVHARQGGGDLLDHPAGVAGYEDLGHFG